MTTRSILCIAAITAITAVTGVSTRAQTLTLIDETLGEPATAFYLGHEVRLDVSGSPGEVMLIVASATPPSSPPFLLNGTPLEIDLFDHIVVSSASLDSSGEASFAFTFPLTGPTGSPLYTQALLVDYPTLNLRLTNGIAPTIESEPFSVLETGYYSKHPLALSIGGGAMLIESNDEWTTFWNDHNSIYPAPPPPAVNFAEFAVVAVFGGTKVTSGYWVEVDRIAYTGLGLSVDATLHVPGACAVVYVITQPFQLVTVAKEVAASPDLALTPIVYNCH